MEIPEKVHLSQNVTRGKSNIILFVILLLVVLSIAFFVYMKNEGMKLQDFNIREFVESVFSTNNSGSAQMISEFKNTAQSHAAFSSCSGQIIICSRDGIEGLDDKGNIQWSKSVSMNNPILKSSGSYSIAYDTSGRDIFAISRKSVQWTKNIDNIILNADINKDGYVAVVKRMDGYKGAVEVFDPEGTWIFTTVISERYIISAKVLPGNSKVLINTIDASGSSAETKLEFTDMRGNNIASILKEDSIFPATSYFGKDQILAVSSSSVFCAGIEEKQIWEHKYDEILSSNTALEKFAVIAIKKNNVGGVLNPRISYIEILNSKGQVSGTFEVNNEVVDVCSFGNTIGANTSREVYFINTAGKLISKYSTKSDIKKVLFMDRYKVAVITSSEIKIIKI